jgi:hypothetical protein
MSRKSSWSERIALSLRVGAIVTVLGFVVLAAEQRLARDVPPQQIISAETAPSFAPAESTSAPVKPVAQQQNDGDYFPSHFPAPQGEPAAQPDTF